MFTPLYGADGALGGAVMLDSATGNLDFYAGDTFTMPTVLTTGVTSWLDMVDDAAVNGTGSVGASTAFLNVKTSKWNIRMARDFFGSCLKCLRGVRESQRDRRCRSQ